MIPPRSRAGCATNLRLPLALLAILLVVAAYFIYPFLRTRGGRSLLLGEWFRNPAAHADWAVTAGQRCGEAPFLIPTSGYIGFIWGDSFRPGHTHQGIDVFGGQEPGETPVVAASDGYLTRLPDWKSTVILRLPSDPLMPGRQIWLYYTHMADTRGNSFIVAEFPPGTQDVFVEAGTLLGYQGNYSGDPINPTGIHLHFSIVLDDGQGRFRNELEIKNTLDPSPYLGLLLDASENPYGIPMCKQGLITPPPTPAPQGAGVTTEK
ncbi:MAG: M23 family metallopeptidase [Anaerolineales bacterium]